jgi:hypothetical protein
LFSWSVSCRIDAVRERCGHFGGVQAEETALASRAGKAAASRITGSSQVPEKIFDTDAGLLQRATKGSDGQNGMSGYNTAALAFLQDHVAASLPDLCESKAFQSANRFVSGNLPQPGRTLVL